MERNHYLSGSFDGLSDGDRDHVLNQRQYFKSSFAKSMARETTKSLNFADLDLTGNDRYNTVGSHRQVILKNKRVLAFLVVPIEASLLNNNNNNNNNLLS